MSEITIENFVDFEDIKFVKRNTPLTILYHFLGVLSLGLLYLVFYWGSLTHLLFKEVQTYLSATHLIIQLSNGDSVICPILEKDFVLNPLDESVRSRMRYFHFAKGKYVYDEQQSHFSKLETRFARGLEEREIFDLDVEVGRLGIDWTNVGDLQETFGKNKLAFKKSSVAWLMFEGLVNPLSITILIFALLCYLAYKLVHAVSFFIYVLLIIVFHVLETRGKESRIEEMSLKESTVHVFRRQIDMGTISSYY
jgi:hypothetical protein